MIRTKAWYIGVPDAGRLYGVLVRSLAVEFHLKYGRCI